MKVSMENLYVDIWAQRVKFPNYCLCTVVLFAECGKIAQGKVFG